MIVILSQIQKGKRLKNVEERLMVSCVFSTLTCRCILKTKHYNRTELKNDDNTFKSPESSVQFHHCRLLSHPHKDVKKQ